MSQIDVDELISNKVQKQNPHIEIIDFDMTLPIVISNLRKGEIPVYATYKGVEKQVSLISESLYNIATILRVYGKFKFTDFYGNETLVESLEKYVEVS